MDFSGNPPGSPPWIPPSQEINVTETPDGNIDFDAGIEVGREEALTQLEGQLVDQGYDPEEVEELLYDPAPKRRGKKHRKAHRRAQYVRAPGHVYDPAPRKRKITAKHTGKKGTLAKLKKYAIPGSAALTFYGAYVKRAEDLFAQGSIPEKSVFKAIEYDVKNFNGTDAMNRVKSQAGEIATPLIASWAVKETKILGKYSGIAADLLAGFGIGVGAKAILDPPANSSGIRSRSNSVIKVVQTQDAPAPQVQRQGYNPYA